MKHLEGNFQIFPSIIILIIVLLSEYFQKQFFVDIVTSTEENYTITLSWRKHLLDDSIFFRWNPVT